MSCAGFCAAFSKRMSCSPCVGFDGGCMLGARCGAMSFSFSLFLDLFDLRDLDLDLRLLDGDLLLSLILSLSALSFSQNMRAEMHEALRKLGYICSSLDAATGGCSSSCNS